MKRTQKHVARAATSLAVSLVFCLSAAAQQHTVRDLSGSVTDTHHEPLRGAVVELQNPANESVTTFITDATGRYDFKRLDGESDYLVWILWRGHKSRVRSISKFDSHTAKVINFTVRAY